MARVTRGPVANRIIHHGSRGHDALHAGALASLSMRRDGYALADDECPHGHMPHDQHITCGCFATVGA